MHTKADVAGIGTDYTLSGIIIIPLFSWRGYFISECCATNVLRFSHKHLLKEEANRSNCSLLQKRKH